MGVKVLLTGGSGDTGTLLAIDLPRQGYEVVNVDVTPPKVPVAAFFQGSILDPNLLTQAMRGVDCVVHLAAWHGIHEKTKTAQDFHDLNVTGTENVLRAAMNAGVKKFVFISSTSVDDEGIYGETKIIGEKMVKEYAARHPEVDFMSLRPRAFVPPWNKSVYNNFLEWAEWFRQGAVHIDDFKDSILLAIDHKPDVKAPVYIIDGAYDYSAADLKNWNSGTFAKYYPDFVDLAREHGLNTAEPPRVLDIPEDMRLPGYVPQYSMKNLLEDIRRFGSEGPPPPFGTDISQVQTPLRSAIRPSR